MTQSVSTLNSASLKMKMLALPLVFIAIVLTSCYKCPDGVPDPNCACILVYEPVCGCDNVTYGNSCQAICAGIDDYKDGECF